MDKKIVGIQTPHYAFNYGAQLQAFALGVAVKDLGFEIEYINRRPSTYSLFRSSWDKFLKTLDLKTKYHGFVDFENRFLQPQTFPIINNREYKDLDTTKYHGVIVGSDQIWRDDYFYSSFEFSPYLYFIEDPAIRKISYAASFGKKTCVHPAERQAEISRFLKQFHAISVREKSGIDILNNYYGVNGVWVLDPTLLHNALTYINLLNLKKGPVRHQIGTYILGGSNKILKSLSPLDKLLHRPFRHVYGRLYHHGILTRFHINRFLLVPSVSEWLELILNSEYIVTDSFHGMVFSIIFNKQFVVLNNAAGGSERYYSLLDALGLHDRIFEWSSDRQMIAKKLREPIDYSIVEDKLSRIVEPSKDFLRSSLL